jgi:predicted Zn finger-like uncharacterized protein
MILTCPECSTKYVVKDGAIPQGGRKVRCASCQHSWHQDPDFALDEVADSAAGESGASAETVPFAGAGDAIEDEESTFDRETAEGPTDITQGPVEEATPTPAVDPQWKPVDTGSAWNDDPAAGPSAQSDEFEPFYPMEEEDETSRRRWPLVGGIILLIAAAIVAFWYLAPSSMKQQVGLAQRGSPLEVMAINNDRQPLASGNDLFTVSGRIINPTGTSQPVPPLRAELLDASKRKVIHSWMISPPVDTLSPNESRVFHSAEMDVPEGGKFIRVRLSTAG